MCNSVARDLLLSVGRRVKRVRKMADTSAVCQLSEVSIGKEMDPLEP